MDSQTGHLADRLIASLIAESSAIAATPPWKAFAYGAGMFGMLLVLAAHIG
ncbi:hypothetical protein [Stenotrophomonas maltophilia]|uniref:hypothetical protein n=1 Tax=Stenotrophomonas maltophilia TaxID=40324 RepID=UPI000ACC4B94|nr:hypothetical protein [Stenotrophomonas maltophilia]MBH1668525.1 hypothetical protein [Stenotrophomonas maltophilia]